jgi:hypothetical protein
MDTNNIYMTVGLFVIILFVIWLFTKLMNLQNNVIEGLSNNKNNDDPVEIVNQLNNKIRTYKDSLLITKYKTNYEDMIIAVEELINLESLKTLREKDVVYDEKSVEKMNHLDKLKSNLDKLMQYIDTYKE